MPRNSCLTHKLTRLCVCFSALICFSSLFIADASAQNRKRNRSDGFNRGSGFNRRAVVIDEDLAVVRDAASLHASSLRRLGRGREVTILNTKRAADGTMFCRVLITRRTNGFIQAEALAQAADDARVLRLIQASEDFDRLARANIFLDFFARSSLRPQVLMIVGEAADAAAIKLTRDAARRLKDDEMKASGATRRSYFLNFAGLDRYAKLGVNFVYDEQSSNFRYNGAAWRELVRVHPKTKEAELAKTKITFLAANEKAKDK